MRVKKTYKEQTYDMMRPELAALVEFTKACRIDMHEPDEQGVSARVVGYHLDNACGEGIDARAVELGYQEFVVILSNGEGCHHKINLASLIALARLTKIPEVPHA